jgi:hypothetical protein
VLVKIQPTLGRADLSTAMWAHIDQLSTAGNLAEVVVASHDAVAFGARLAALADRVAVTVLAFRERAGFAAGRAGIGFVDLESIPGAFAAPLPRTNLFDLPTEGRVLPPLRRPELPALDAGPRLVAVPPVADTTADTSSSTPVLSSVGAPPASKPPSSLLVPSSMPSAAVLTGPGSGGGGPTPAAATPTVIDLSEDAAGDAARPSVFDAPPAPLVEGAPPPPPPPPPWRPGAASLPSTGAADPAAPAPPAPDGSPGRPGRVMPPNHG